MQINELTRSCVGAQKVPLNILISGQLQIIGFIGVASSAGKKASWKGDADPFGAKRAKGKYQRMSELTLNAT